MAYVPIDRFLVRAPLLPAAPLADAARRLMRDPLGASALKIASASLTAQTRTSRAAQALDRYARRAAFRATPAGLLAGVTVGTLGARTGGATGAPRAYLAPSWARIARLARALLEDPEARDQVHLRCAPSLLRGADRVRWLAGGADVAEEREADLDARLARILDACGDWTPWPALRAAAAGTHGSDGVVVPLRRPAGGEPLSDDDSAADADELLLLLLDDELLCCDLTPPLVGPPAARWMADRLAALRPPPLAAAILARAITALDNGDLDAGRSALRELPGPANLDGESDGDSSDAVPDLVATLVHQPGQALTLERSTVERAARLAPLLFRLQDALAPPAAERDGDPHALDALADTAELFGEGTLDAAAWALGDYGVDPSAGEDDGALAGRSAAPPPALVRLLVDEIAAARAARRAEISLDAAALDRLLPAAAPPGTCELFLTPAPLRTAWLLGVHAPAGASWGRFAHALGSDFADAFAALDTVERAAQPHQRRLDVAYAPGPALADLCAHPPVRDGVLALSGWPARETDRARRDGPQAFRPSELGMVTMSSVDGLALTAQMSDGACTDDVAPTEVVPSPLARVRSTTAPAGLPRLLAGFSLYRQHAPWALSLGALADLAHVPRISIDGFVVSPASWRIPAALDARAFSRWRRGGDGVLPLPRFVQVGVEDQLLPVDLDRPQAWRDLSGQPRAWEIWPPLADDDEQAGSKSRRARARRRGPARTVDRDGRRIEAVVALVDDPDDAGVRAAEARQQAIAAAGPVPPPRLAPPAPGWRTFALYGAEERQDDVLLDAVVPAVRGALDAGEIDHWFFVRYADERGRRPHLRLRTHAADRAHADRFAARLDRHLHGARASGAVTRVETSAYHPELARFGGHAGVGAALHIFESDSDLACALLAAGRGPGDPGLAAASPDDRRLDAIDQLVATFDGLAAGLGFELRERHQLARGRRAAESAALDALVAAEPRALDADFRARSRRLRAVLGALPDAESSEPDLRRIASYRVHVAAAVGELTEAVRARLAPPLLHLCAVRLAGADRGAEARAYLLWERTLEGLVRSPSSETRAEARGGAR
jgi:thiopeptide-type bacteriocin biosynthesis protein